MDFDDDFIEANFGNIQIKKVCPDCGSETAPVPFVDSDIFEELNTAIRRCTFLETRLDYETLEQLETGGSVVLEVGQPCQGVRCTLEGRNDIANAKIAVPKNFTDVPPAKSLELINEFGVFLTGGVGVGKTYKAVSYLKAWLAEHERDTHKFINVCELLFNMHNEFGKTLDTPILKECMHTDILLLDDLGTEKFSEWATSQLYLLISYRHDNIKPTIVTSNLDLEEIYKMNPRIASRLSSYTCVHVKGRDRRV